MMFSITNRFPVLQLKSLGELCGLVSEKGPTSEDLNRTVDLLAGLGDERPETGESCWLVLRTPALSINDFKKVGFDLGP